jgi:hypothetical protein
VGVPDPLDVGALELAVLALGQGAEVAGFVDDVALAELVGVDDVTVAASVRGWPFPGSLLLPQPTSENPRINPETRAIDTIDRDGAAGDRGPTSEGWVG